MARTREEAKKITFMSLQTSKALQAMLRIFWKSEVGEKVKLENRLMSISMKDSGKKLIQLGTPKEQCKGVLEDDLSENGVRACSSRT